MTPGRPIPLASMGLHHGGFNTVTNNFVVMQMKGIMSVQMIFYVEVHFYTIKTSMDWNS